MSLGTRCGLLLLAAAGCFALNEYALVGRDPTEITELTLRQMDSSDDAAEALRVADASKNWLQAAWPLGLVALLGALLFHDEAVRFLKRGRAPAGTRPPFGPDHAPLA